MAAIVLLTIVCFLVPHFPLSVTGSEIFFGPALHPGENLLATQGGAMGLNGVIEGYDASVYSAGDPVTAVGIDVSYYQGTIDWNTVAQNIDFAILRCGYGDDLVNQDDSKWKYNADECTRLGIPFGVYIYSYALTDSQALSEAQHVLRLVEGYDPQLPIYLDLEEDDILEHCSTADILRHTKIFCEAIEAAGYEVGVYANYNWWTNYLTSSEYDQWDRWIARYASATGYSKEYTIWQYTSSGKVNGISGNVDMNYWYGAFPPNSSHTHAYTSYVSMEATCTRSGSRVYSCSCGDSYTESIPATGHSYTQATTAATCTMPGYTTYHCGACGDSYQADSTAALGHNYASAVTPADCTTGGYTEHTCSRCGDHYRDAFTDALGHSFKNGACTRCGVKDEALQSGDLDGDGSVTSADAVMLSRYLVGLQTLGPNQQTAADLNQDGAVSSADAVKLARLLAGLN